MNSERIKRLASEIARKPEAEIERILTRALTPLVESLHHEYARAEKAEAELDRRAA